MTPSRPMWAGVCPTKAELEEALMPREPVYQRKEELADGVTCYLGDMREILPSLGRFDACVTDPPYGIGITRSNRLAVSRGMGGKTWDDAPIDAKTIALLKAAGERLIIWGGNYFDLPPTRAPLVWDKNNAGRDFADFEMAWTNLDMVARRFVFRPMNMDGGKEHPAQKPIEVMNWCLGFLSPGTRVVDPFMGSGSTGVSCVKRGFGFTGVEIDPGYFELACRRISDALKAPDLFIETPKPIKQEALL